MNLSYKILSVFGIDIELHLFFILFILAFALLSLQLALFLVLIFFFVTLHELTHSIVAIRNKIRVRKIVLLPIGGMSMVESADIKPITEIKMAIAGPLLNIVFVYICIIIAYLMSWPLGSWLSAFLDPTQALDISLPQLALLYSFYANLILGVFNLFLPAFPLDGGRVFRALLALRLDYVRASRIAKNVSLVLSSLLFLIAFIYGEIWIMIIAFFIAFGAVAEFDAMVMHKTLMQISTKGAVSRRFLTVGQSESIASALSKMLAGKRTAAIIRTKTGIKIVTLYSIAKLSGAELKKKAVSIAKPIGYVSVDASIEQIIRIMDEKELPMVPVFDGKRLAGVVERFEIERLLRIMQTLGRLK
jgi:Zn-dependent protease/CBS domain-containing protein